jgi:hypothetical protein
MWWWVCHPHLCGPCYTIEPLQHLDISTTSSPKTLDYNHTSLIFDVMDHGNNPLDQDRIGSYKHIKEVKNLVHKLNAPSINVE